MQWPLPCKNVFVAPTFHFLIAVTLTVLNQPSPTSAVKCYSCDGVCHRNQRCNCQTGLCDGPFCFSTRSYEYSAKGYIVKKGCVNRIPTETVGCFSTKQPGAVTCFCNGEYCNGRIEPPASLISDANSVTTNSISNLANISCYDCSTYAVEQSCFETCSDGSYCQMSLDSRTSSCGRGVPKLPYTHWGDRFLGGTHAGGACVFLNEGNRGLVSRTCACSRNRCNNRSLLKLAYDWLALEEANNHVTSVAEAGLVNCYSCHEVGAGPTSPQACRQNTCVGHFCTLTLSTYASIRHGLHYERTAGCLNTTHPELIFSGCYQQWITDREEFIQCACAGQFCNKSLGQASRESGAVSKLFFCAATFLRMQVLLVLIMVAVMKRILIGA